MPPVGLLRKGLTQNNIDTTFDLLKIRPLNAGIAQLVEHDLAKVGVASSSLVSRSRCLVKNAHVAQVVERILGKDEVDGSNPFVSSSVDGLR